MVQAKPEQRSRARDLRRAGKTYDEIVAELGVSKSSVSLWVKDLPKPRRDVTAHMDRMREARRRKGDVERARVKAEARAEVGALTDRELLLVGVGLYWAEGAKDKPYGRRESLTFVNSDPGMIVVFLRWLALFGVGTDRLSCRVMIHENADIGGAERFWADLVGLGVADLGKTTLKRHNPRTVRKNTGDTYRGCLVVYVRRSADLYRRVEGWWHGITKESNGGAAPGVSGRV